MRVLFIGENIYKSKGGIVAVMSQILNDDFLNAKINFIPVFTSGDDFSLAAKILGWSKALILFFYYLPKVDIIHIHHAADLNFELSIRLASVAKLFNKKVLLHNHAANFKDYYSQLSGKRKNYLGKQLSRVDASIILSRSWQDWYSKTFPKAKWILLHNAIKIPQKFTKPKNRGGVRLIYLSRVEERKGIFDLLNILTQIKKIGNFHLYIGGNGEITKLKLLIRDLDIDNLVTYMGYLDHVGKRELLINGDIFILPSYDEGLPIALLEAMSYKNVPVSTYVGGIPEVINNKVNGILLQPGDMVKLKESLEELINNNVLREKMASEAEKTIKNSFNLKNYTRSLLQIYEEL